MLIHNLLYRIYYYPSHVLNIHQIVYYDILEITLNFNNSHFFLFVHHTNFIRNLVILTCVTYSLKGLQNFVKKNVIHLYLLDKPSAKNGIGSIFYNFFRERTGSEYKHAHRVGPI